MTNRKDEITDREAVTAGALVAALPQGKDMENHAAVMAERLAVKANKRPSTFDEVWALGNAEFKSIQRSSVEDIARHFFLLGCATTDEAAKLPPAVEDDGLKNVTPEPKKRNTKR